MSGIINSAGSKSGVIGETEIDYEEVIQSTPLMVGSTNQVSFGSNNSRYTKVGNICTIFYEFDTASYTLVEAANVYLNAPFVTANGIRVPCVFYSSGYNDRWLSGGGGSLWAIWSNLFAANLNVGSSERLIFSMAITYRIS